MLTPQEKKKEPEVEIEEDTAEEADERTFKQYEKALNLTAEDFARGVLDVGPDSADFARIARWRHPDGKIHSLDSVKGLTGGDAIQQYMLRHSADEKPGLIILHTGIPQFFTAAAADDPEVGMPMRKQIQKNVHKMLDAIDPDGEIRIGPVSEGGCDFQRYFYRTLRVVLRDLDGNGGARVEWVEKKKTADGKEYLIKIKKL